MSMFHELMMKKKGMPSRYELVDYIESTETQYIDTEIVPTENTKFVCDVAFTDISAGRFGALKGTRYYFGVLSNKFIGANSSTYNHSIADADTNRHIFTVDSLGLSIDNVLVYSSSAYCSNMNSLYLFATHDGATINYYSKAKLYSCQILENSRLVRNYIPVYDTETQKYGMWESVQGKFYGNDGTGDFKGSIVGYTIVGSPTITDGVLINPTSSNYLIIDKYLSADRIEVSIPFSFDTLNWNDIFWGKRNQQQNVLLEITSGGVMRIYFNQGIPGYFDTARLNSNINYRIDITLTYDNFAYKIINEDSNIIVKEDLKERTTKAIPYLDIPCFGRNASNSKIAIKDTIIKADNKLWFNGQEA